MKSTSDQPKPTKNITNVLDDRRDRSEQPVFCSQLCNLMHHIVSRGLWRNYDEPEMVKLTTCDPEASRRFTAKNAFPRFSSKSLPIVPSNRRRMFQTLFAPVRIWWNVIVTLSSLFCEVEVSLRPEKKFRPFLTNIDTRNLQKKSLWRLWNRNLLHMSVPTTTGRQFPSGKSEIENCSYPGPFMRLMMVCGCLFTFLRKPLSASLNNGNVENVSRV